MAVAAYLDKYFECVEYLPLELQRCITDLRLAEINAAGSLSELSILKPQLLTAINHGDDDEQQAKLFRAIQEALLTLRNIGNEKLTITSRLVEITEEYEQQLIASSKAIEGCGNEEFYQTPRHQGESKPKRSSGTKRSRDVEDSESVNGRSTTPALNGANKLNKKKIKTVKKKPIMKPSQEESSPVEFPTPMPDLSSQPLDPNEPLYCLCQQVSFGEMIGCDNEECPIEWFHFGCVNLSSKPKGRWYCPQCTQSLGRKLNKPFK